MCLNILAQTIGLAKVRPFLLDPVRNFILVFQMYNRGNFVEIILPFYCFSFIKKTYVYGY